MTEAKPNSIVRPPWKLPFVVLLIVVVGFAILFITQWRTLSVEAREDIHFNHQKHVSAGVQCIFCHPGALNGPYAGRPSVRKCVGCHANVQVAIERQKDIDQLLQFANENRPLNWVKRFDLPDFVHFSHQPHILTGLACETCHGDVGRQVQVHPTFRINMGFCISCHNKQQPRYKVDKLTTCTTCHY